MARRRNTGPIRIGVAAASVAGFLATFLWIAQQPATEQVVQAADAPAAPATIQQVVTPPTRTAPSLAPASQVARRVSPVTRSKAS